MFRKELESDDPMELLAVECDGDQDYMIDCVAEEYARLGWPAKEIVLLFESPFYPALHLMLRARGAETVRRRIEAVVARCGVFRTRTFEADPEPELVTIGGSPHE